MSFNKVLLAGAALAVFSFAAPSFAMDEVHHTETTTIHHAEMPADHGAPEGHAMAEEVQHEQVKVVKTTETTTTTHWGYGSADGATHWAAMDDAYKACAEGKMQSPINIAEFMRQDLPKLKVAYAESPLVISNNGNTLQVNYQPGSKFMSEEKIYDLAQVHFRTPSEHYIDGAPYPMEMQLLHTTPEGDMAIVSVMMKLGMHNSEIQQIWDFAPAAGEQVVPEGIMIRAADLLPKNGTYYTYTGSLTTPPCSEGVKWHVLQEPVEISLEQLTAFQSMFPNNARPVQPMHGRVVKGS